MDRRSPSPGLKMTGVQIDSSRLPPVQEVCRDFAVLEDGAFVYCLQEQEIEQHYASNIQRNQLVQKDLRVAKSLQDVEDRVSRLKVSQKEKQGEGSDPTVARPVQEDVQQEGARSLHRTEAGQEPARRLQGPGEDEEVAADPQQEGQPQSLPEGTAHRDDPLAWLVAEESLQSQEQLRQDEELAWRLQEEEHARAARARRNRERNDDYRVAQVAQDEEIARYMQDQELEPRLRSPGTESASEAGEGVPRGRSEPRWSHNTGQVEKDGDPRQKGRRGAPPVVRVPPLGRSETPVRGAPPAAPKRSSVGGPQLCRNIAEDLDPTFKARGGGGVAGRPEVAAPPVHSRAVPPICPVPVDGFFDYLDELAGPAFVSPTKRQSEKAGHPKPREKKEGCKQQ